MSAKGFNGVMEIESIVEKFRKKPNKDGEEYKMIVSHYYKKIYKYVYNILKDNDDAFDVVQDVFFDLLRKISSYNPKYPFEVFLYTIAYRDAVSKYRKRKILSKIVFWKDEYNELFSSGNDYIIFEHKKLLSTVMKNLNSSERTILYFRYTEAMSSKEIGDILGIKAAYVDVLHSRILLKLKTEVENV